MTRDVINTGRPNVKCVALAYIEKSVIDCVSPEMSPYQIKSSLFFMSTDFSHCLSNIFRLQFLVVLFFELILNPYYLFVCVDIS